MKEAVHMLDTPTGEFWKDLRPIEASSRPDVLPEVSPSKVATDRHYHRHEVFAYAISGKWGYLERPWTATAGAPTLSQRCELPGRTQEGRAA